MMMKFIAMRRTDTEERGPSTDTLNRERVSDPTDQSDSTAGVFIGVITWCAFFFYISDQLMVLR